MRMAHSYGLEAHALITLEAAERSSALNADSGMISQELGLDRLDMVQPFSDSYPALNFTPLAASYFDEEPVAYPMVPDIETDFIRGVQQQERGPMQVLIERGYLPSILEVGEFEFRTKGWLVRGAVREDDNDVIRPVFGWTNYDERDDDPHGDLFRSSKHFYDPFRDRAFDYVGPCVDSGYGCLPSTAWAIGTIDPLIAEDDVENSERRNHFSWQDARNNLWHALTLNREVDVSDHYLNRRVSAKERKWRWATAFKSLGHVLHLVQDAAQPQHSRNDAHAPPKESLNKSRFLG